MEILIYSKKDCKYCVMAKKLLDGKWLKYDVIDVTDNEELKKEMISRSGGKRTVPQIFINNIHIGGYDSLEKYLS